jgi:hypothetical protein
MATEFVPFSAEWEPAVARFNRRMREGNAPADFDIPEKAVAPRTASVNAQMFVAVEGGEVRGGMIIQEHPGVISDSDQPRGSLRREPVINLQSPLSEAIIDPKYSMVSIQLFRFALKRCPYAYVVGMGGEERPLPRLLKAFGWSVRQVPFLFRILNARRCLTQLKPLQRKPAMRVAAVIAAYSGGGAAAMALLQHRRVSVKGYRLETAHEDAAADDAVWAGVEKRISFGVVRDSTTMASYLWPGVERFRVFRGTVLCGWFSMMCASMRDHNYFGNLKVATLIDIMVIDAADAAAVATLAVQYARTKDCDLVVSNQLHEETQNALRSVGFIPYASNYLIASSKPLTAAMNDATSLVSRQDGDGLVNLRGPSPIDVP